MDNTHIIYLIERKMTPDRWSESLISPYLRARKGNLSG
jgi:hypothetical protein